MYYGHEAGLLRIAEMRHKAAAERRAREASGAAEKHREEAGHHPARWSWRLWSKTA